VDFPYFYQDAQAWPAKIKGKNNIKKCKIKEKD
jgi:hypothetical protein